MLEYPHLGMVYAYMFLFMFGIFTEICIIGGEIRELYCHVKDHKNKNESSKYKKKIRIQLIDGHDGRVT